MNCGGWGVTPILVGLQRVGIVGFRDVLKKIDPSSREQRDAIVDQVIDNLAADNYIPDRSDQAFRTAIWRECLRSWGEDFSEFFSVVEVTVRGESGEERDRFVEMLESVFAEFELRPIVTYGPSSTDGSHPQLVSGGHLIVSGTQTRRLFKDAVRKSFSDW